MSGRAAVAELDLSRPDNDHMADIVQRRAQRAVRAILEYKDTLRLAPESSEQLRTLVRREIFDLTDLALQLIESLTLRCSEGVVNNELYGRLLQEIHAVVVEREE